MIGKNVENYTKEFLSLDHEQLAELAAELKVRYMYMCKKCDKLEEELEDTNDTLASWVDAIASEP